MRSVLLLLIVLAVVSPDPAGAQTTEPGAEQVRHAELAFAASMAARDLEQFARYLAEEAIFFGPSGPLRGKSAVVEGWRSFFDGPTAPFSWEPETVEVLASGTLALSSGPVRDPAGRRIGTFNSVWRREGDGRWRVIFDKGCPAPN